MRTIFRHLFEKEPLIIKVPNWSRLTVSEFISQKGLEADSFMLIGLSARPDSEFHFYNDAYQSHISGMVTSTIKEQNWAHPMELVARQFIRQGHPVRGFNLYFMGMEENKKGKVYDLLLKVALAKLLNEVFELGLNQEQLSNLIRSVNRDSIVDALLLSQIYQEVEIVKRESEAPLKCTTVS